MKHALYLLGRLLQLLGLLILPAAIAGNLAPGQPLDLRGSLTLSGIGVAAFYLGRFVQQMGHPE